MILEDFLTLIYLDRVVHPANTLAQSMAQIKTDHKVLRDYLSGMADPNLATMTQAEITAMQTAQAAAIAASNAANAALLATNS